MPRKVDEESALMRRIAKRLEQTEEELNALPPDQRERITSYLFARYAWFERKAVPKS
jgi:hypothetical protein